MAMPTIEVSLPNFARIAVTVEWLAHAPSIYDTFELGQVLCDMIADTQGIVGGHEFVGVRAEDGNIYVDDAEGQVFLVTVKR